MGAENIACETETCMLDEKSIAERLSMTVNILERYLQTRRGARGNLLFDTSYREAVKACAPFPSEEKNHPLLADKSVRFWQGEALSHFRKSSWEGELILTLVVKYHSCHRVCNSSLNSTEVMLSFYVFYDQ